jgi:hypothetical protein
MRPVQMMLDEDKGGQRPAYFKPLRQCYRRSQIVLIAVL